MTRRIIIIIVGCSQQVRQLRKRSRHRTAVFLLLLLLLGGSSSSALLGSTSSSLSSQIGNQSQSKLPKSQRYSPFQNNNNPPNTMTPATRRRTTRTTQYSITPTDDDDESLSSWMGGASSGRTLLLGVAFLYGTLNVSLKLVYEASTPSLPPSAASLSAVRGWLAALGFAGVSLWSSSRRHRSSTATASILKGDENADDPIFTTIPTADTISSSSLVLLRDGTELAIWNGLAQGLLNAGLLTVGSARASFLTQTSVIWTPLLTTLLLLFGPFWSMTMASLSSPSSSSSSSPSKSLEAATASSTAKIPAATTWIGCGIALSGLFRLSGIIMGGGGGGGGLDTSSMLTWGDGLVIGGALAWSAYLYRLEQIGSRHANHEIALQGCKTTVLAILYSIWWIVSSTGTTTTTAAAVGGVISSLSSSMAWLVGPGAWVAWAALTYSAWGPGILADIWQQQGQRTVSASETNVLLSLEPVFAALCGRLFLGETLTRPEYQGGALIVLAALVTSMTNTTATGSDNADEKKIHKSK